MQAQQIRRPCTSGGWCSATASSRIRVSSGVLRVAHRRRVRGIHGAEQVTDATAVQGRNEPPIGKIEKRKAALHLALHTIPLVPAEAVPFVDRQQAPAHSRSHAPPVRHPDQRCPVWRPAPTGITLACSMACNVLMTLNFSTVSLIFARRRTPAVSISDVALAVARTGYRYCRGWFPADRT